MDFGDAASLRELARELSTQGDGTETLHDQIDCATSGLSGSVGRYEQNAARAFSGRWDDVGSVLKRLATDSQSLSRGLTTLAGGLDAAKRDWDSAGAGARAAGFAVAEAGPATTVTAPADAADGSDDQALAFQTRLRSAAGQAGDAVGTLRRLLGDVSGHGLAALGGDHSGAVSARTGDPSTDGELAQVVRPMLAAHANLPRTA